jgi:hypothetical protein
MILDDRHIAYLKKVEAGHIKLWWGHRKLFARYVNNQPSEFGWHSVDQTVAAQMKALGLTRIVNSGGLFAVRLTSRGEAQLEDEKEAWTQE